MKKHTPNGRMGYWSRSLTSHNGIFVPINFFNRYGCTFTTLKYSGFIKTGIDFNKP